MKYWTLFLTICYNQLVFILVYYNCKKFGFNFFNNTWFFGDRIIFFFTKIQSTLCMFLLFLLSLLGWIIVSWRGPKVLEGASFS